MWDGWGVEGERQAVEIASSVWGRVGGWAGGLGVVCGKGVGARAC